MFAECLHFTTPDLNGWRKDFSGQDFLPTGVYAGYKLTTSFDNSKTGIDARVKLDLIDSPLTGLPDHNGNNEVINSYALDQQFETYITYYADSINDPNDPNPIPQGQEFRHAIAILPWKWNANVKQNGSTWKFTGSHYPTVVTNLLSSPKPFVQNSPQERPFSGRYNEDLDPDPFQRCASNPPITITTKRNIAVWRKSGGVWYVVNPDGSFQSTGWGVDYDIPVPGDYDGDGKADFAVYRPDNPATPENECQNGCTWYVLNSSNGSFQIYPWGAAEDKPVPADYDGDGKTDMAVFRPSTGTWYAVRSSDSTFFIAQFGNNGDVPVPSDYDGDGIDDVAVWSPSTASWSIRSSSNNTATTQAWGSSTDKPVIGDYDGDGKTDIANWQSNGNWHIRLSADGQTKDVNFGLFATDTSVPGDYDGDGKTDIAIWRPNGNQSAQWWILNSSNNQVQVQSWGLAGDVPIPAAYTR